MDYIDAIDNPKADTPGTTEQAIAYYLTAYAVVYSIESGRPHMGFRRIFSIARRRQAAIDARMKGDR
jgi:hypothetical protein